ncbi:MAG TPA: hypothetical protein VMC42_08235 [Methanoregulaceae archaeon]|nr:hypothetical protein [Methanoregulaceae archaeon]
MVSTDDSDIVPLRESLEKNGHRVTVLAEDLQLMDTLRQAAPDLLIYEVKTGGPENYDFIRCLKDDLTVGSIPVLALVKTATIEDLLNVLESNADNFITPPYNHPDNISLVENMIKKPAGLQKGDEIEKQYRVRHDDHIYVISCTSRKLLEYLLSSFELLSRKSSESASLKKELQVVSESLQDRERVITAGSMNIEALNETIRKNEQEILASARGYEELTNTLSQKADEVKTLKEKLDSSLERLNSMERARNEEKIQRAALEKDLHDLTSELEQQKSALVAEKQFSTSVEQEINTLKETSSQSERDLNQTITGLNERITQYERELILLKNDLEAEIDRRISAEKRAEKLVKEYELTRNTAHTETDSLNRKVTELQEALAVSSATLGTEREMRRISEEKTTALIRQQEDLEKHLMTAREETERVKSDNVLIIGQITKELETARQRVKSLEAQVGSPGIEGSNAGREVQIPESDAGTPRIFLTDKPDSHSDPAAGPEGMVREHHLVQLPLLQPGELLVSEEKRDLVVQETPHLPLPVKKEPAEDFSSAAGRTQDPLPQSIQNKDSGVAETAEIPGNGFPSGSTTAENAQGSKGEAQGSDISFDGNQWLGLIKWAHHSDALTEDQRLKIIRMGRLIQKDRKLTKRQQDQVREILSLVRTLGYKSS